MKTAATMIALLIVFSGFALGQDETEAVEITGAEELEKQKSKLWEEVWVRPEADIASYDNLYIWQTVFQFRDVSDSPQNRTTTAMMKGDQDYYTISDESRAKFEEIVSSAVVEELNEQFSDIVRTGQIVKIGPTPAELASDDHVDLPRLRFRFDRRQFGRLRCLIDHLNGMDRPVQSTPQ